MSSKFKPTIDLFNVVLGVYLRLREFHFNTHIEAEHNLTNTCMPEIMDFADAVMENAMGILDARPGMDITTVVPCKESSITSSLQHLRDEVGKYKELVKDQEHAGIINILDDFTEQVNKWIYLSRNK